MRNPARFFQFPRVLHWVALVALAGLLGPAVLAQPRVHRNGVVYKMVAGEPLVFDASVPMVSDGAAAVIVVHGGGWEAGDRRTYVNPLLRLLEDSAYAWFSIDYRLAPAHPFPAATEDVEAAVRHIHGRAGEFGIDPSRVVLIGESSGGHLASLAGARDQGLLAGVVSFYGIHNFETWWRQRGGVPRNSGLFLEVSEVDADAIDRAREASPVTFVHAGMPPFLLIHGDQDEGVPLAQSEEMCRRVRSAGGNCEMYVVTGAGHGMENWEENPLFHGWKPRLREWLGAVFSRRASAKSH